MGRRGLCTQGTGIAIREFRVTESASMTSKVLLQFANSALAILVLLV